MSKFIAHGLQSSYYNRCYSLPSPRAAYTKGLCDTHCQVSQRPPSPAATEGSVCSTPAEPQWLMALRTGGTKLWIGFYCVLLNTIIEIQIFLLTNAQLLIHHFYLESLEDPKCYAFHFFNVRYYIMYLPVMPLEEDSLFIDCLHKTEMHKSLTIRIWLITVTFAEVIMDYRRACRDWAQTSQLYNINAPSRGTELELRGKFSK